MNPKDARTLALKAYCEAKLGSAGDAARDVDQAVALAPTDREVLYKKALVHALAGDAPAALTALADAIKNGYSVSLVASDRDWRPFHSSQEFQRLIAGR